MAGVEAALLKWPFTTVTQFYKWWPRGREYKTECLESVCGRSRRLRHWKQQGIREIYGRAFHTSVVKLCKAGGSHAWQRISDLVPAGLLLRRAAADISCTGVKPHSCLLKQATLSEKSVTDFSTTIELAGLFTCKGC